MKMSEFHSALDKKPGGVFDMLKSLTQNNNILRWQTNHNWMQWTKA